MYIITCKRNGDDLKLVNDELIGIDWGKDIFKAKVFNTKQDVINFIINEPKFNKINNGRLPFLLSDIDINSVHIRKIEEIKYRNTDKIKFTSVLNKIKEIRKE